MGPNQGTHSATQDDGRLVMPETALLIVGGEGPFAKGVPSRGAFGRSGGQADTPQNERFPNDPPAPINIG
jgi:hypothetical protein